MTSGRYGLHPGRELHGCPCGAQPSIQHGAHLGLGEL